MSYGVPTVGVVGFEADATTYFEAPNTSVCRGSSDFTVLVALQTCIPNAAAEVIAGNFTGGSGWYLERGADTATGVQYIFRVVTGGIALTIDVPNGLAYARTLLLGLTITDTGFVATAYSNGGEIDSDTYGAAFVPGAGAFGLGGDGAGGTSDRIISVGYINSHLSATQMAELWNNFRQTSLRAAALAVLGVGFAYSYEASDISTPPNTSMPTLWPNGGTVGSATLAWQGSAAPGEYFVIDRSPDYTGGVVVSSTPPDPPPAPGTITDLYLSGANGNDANDGLTPATARATVEGIFELFPATLYGPLVVHVGAAGVVGDDVAYDWASMPTPHQANEMARIWIYGDGAGQPGEDGFEEITTDVCAAGTDAQQITIAAPVVANVYQGFTLEVLDGPAAGYRRTIQQNTTTSLITIRQFDNQAGALGGTTPVAGNAFRIVRPSVIFTGIGALPQGQPGFLGNTGGGDSAAPLFVVNVAFEAVSASVEINNCAIYMAGVEFRGTNFPLFANCTGSVGWWDNIDCTTTPLLRNNTIDTEKSEWFADIGMVAALARLAEWRGWGASSPDVVAPIGTVNYFQLSACNMSVVGVFGPFRVASGACAIGGYFWGTFRGSSAAYFAVVGRGFTIADSSVFRYFVALSNNAVFDGRMPISMTSVSGGFLIDTGCYVLFQSGSSIAVSTILTQAAVQLRQGALLHLNGTTTLSSPVTTLGVLNASGTSRIVGPNAGSQTLTVTHTSGLVAINLVDGSAFHGATGTFTFNGTATVNGSYMRCNGNLTMGATSLSNTGALIVDGTTTLTSLTLVGASEAVFNSTSAIGAVSVTQSTLLGVGAATWTSTLTGDDASMDFTSTLSVAGATSLSGGTLSVGGLLTLAALTTVEGAGIQGAAITQTGLATLVDSTLIFTGVVQIGLTDSTVVRRSRIQYAGSATFVTTTMTGGSTIVGGNTGGTTTTFSGTLNATQSDVRTGNTTVVTGNLIASDAKLFFFDDMNVNVNTTLNRTEMVVGGGTGMTGTLTATDSQLTTTANSNFTGLVTFNASTFNSFSAMSFGNGFIAQNGSSWLGRGNMGASACSIAVGTPLTVTGGSNINLLGVTAGTFTINGRPAGMCARIGSGSTFSFVNARIAMNTADTGIDLSGGGRIYVDGEPTNVTGVVDDFLDEQGGYQNTLFPTPIAVLVGQHPAGVYDAAGNVVSSGFVQRVA